MDLNGRLMSLHRGPRVAIGFPVAMMPWALQDVLSVACLDGDCLKLIVPVIEPEPLALPGVARKSDETTWGRDPCPLEIEARRVEGGGRPAERPETCIAASERRQHQRGRPARAEALL